MQSEKLKQLFKKYNCEAIMTSNKYLEIDNYLVFDDSFAYTDSLMKKMEDEENLNLFVSFKILSLTDEIEIEKNGKLSFRVGDLKEIDKKIFNNLKKLNLKIIKNEIKEYMTKYQEKNLCKNQNTYISSRYTIAHVTPKDLSNIILLYLDSIQKEGIKNENYGLIFKMLSACYQEVKREFGEEKLNICKNALLQVIQDNPDFFNTETRKKASFKKLIMEGITNIYDINFINQFVEKLNLKINTDIFLIKQENDNLFISPNYEMSILNKFEENFNNQNYKLKIFSYVLKNINNEYWNELVSNIVIPEIKLFNNDEYSFKLSTKFDKEILKNLINDLYEHTLKDKNFIKSMRYDSEAHINTFIDAIKNENFQNEINNICREHVLNSKTKVSVERKKNKL